MSFENVVLVYDYINMLFLSVHLQKCWRCLFIYCQCIHACYLQWNIVWLPTNLCNSGTFSMYIESLHKISLNECNFVLSDYKFKHTTQVFYRRKLLFCVCEYSLYCFGTKLKWVRKRKHSQKGMSQFTFSNRILFFQLNSC